MTEDELRDPAVAIVGGGIVAQNPVRLIVALGEVVIVGSALIDWLRGRRKRRQGRRP